MSNSTRISKQLDEIKSNYAFWGSTEIAALANILLDDEVINSAVNGYYSGGFGMLVITNFRALIVDKKPFTFNVEDIRFDMITEVNYNARFLIATILMCLPTRTLYFTSWNTDRLHKAMRQVQQHVMDTKGSRNMSSLPADWFTTQQRKHSDRQSVISAIARLAQFAVTKHENTKDIVKKEGNKPPSLLSTSSQRGINPYTRFPVINRRRKYPAFYNY